MQDFEGKCPIIQMPRGANASEGLAANLESPRRGVLDTLKVAVNRSIAGELSLDELRTPRQAQSYLPYAYWTARAGMFLGVLGTPAFILGGLACLATGKLALSAVTIGVGAASAAILKLSTNFYNWAERMRNR